VRAWLPLGAAPGPDMNSLSSLSAGEDRTTGQHCPPGPRTLCTFAALSMVEDYYTSSHATARSRAVAPSISQHFSQAPACSA
jgi:hypothetical protein